MQPATRESKRDFRVSESPIGRHTQEGTEEHAHKQMHKSTHKQTHEDREIKWSGIWMIRGAVSRHTGGSIVSQNEW